MNRLSLTAWILIGLALGILTGIFFGERAEVLNPLGNGFIRLLQMAVLPYFIVSLPLGFGRLSFEEAKLLGVRLMAFSLVLWSLGICLVILLPLTFPAIQSANFFSAAMVETSEPVNFVDLYIPANPFQSLSEAVIPGVVVFGIALGIALIGVPEKKQLLTILDSLADALGRITGFVVKLTPIGVFALAASAAGTMTLEDLSRLQVYLVAYTIGAALLTFWLVPMLVASMTPFSYRDVMRATRDPLVTGFTTGNLLVVLAMLAENCKHLFQEQEELSRGRAESVVDVSLPIAFTFPNLGVVLLLLFIPFAGWFTGNPVELAEYPKMCVLGFFSFFGSVEMGLPFVLQQLRIPTDMFQLHVVTLVYIGRLATMLAVMHLAGAALLTAAGNAGWLKIRPRRLCWADAVEVNPANINRRSKRSSMESWPVRGGDLVNNEICWHGKIVVSKMAVDLLLYDFISQTIHFTCLGPLGCFGPRSFAWSPLFRLQSTNRVDLLDQPRWHISLFIGAVNVRKWWIHHQRFVP